MKPENIINSFLAVTIKLTEVNVAFLGLILGICTTCISLIVWYTNFQKRRYGLERDFQHMVRNLDQLKLNLDYISKDFDKRFDGIDLTLESIKNSLEFFYVKKDNK